MRMALVGWGREGALHSSAAGPLRENDGALERLRGSLNERYENTPSGIELSWEVTGPPEGDGDRCWWSRSNRRRSPPAGAGWRSTPDRAHDDRAGGTGVRPGRGPFAGPGRNPKRTEVGQNAGERPGCRLPPAVEGTAHLSRRRLAGIRSVLRVPGHQRGHCG